MMTSHHAAAVHQGPCANRVMAVNQVVGAARARRSSSMKGKQSAEFSTATPRCRAMRTLAATNREISNRSFVGIHVSQSTAAARIIPKHSNFAPTPTTIIAAATASSSNTDISMLPNSREDSISQACSAIAANLPATKSATSSKSGGKKNKKVTAADVAGFSGSAAKLSVEIPVADESEAAALQLAADLVAGLPSPWPSQFTIISAFPGSTSQYTLANTTEEVTTTTLSSCIILVAPKISQIDQVEALLGNWRGAVAVLLNAEWCASGGEDDAGVPVQHTAFARSFNAVYCFQPLLIKAFVVTTQEGAVFRCAASKRKGFTSSSTGGGGNSGNDSSSDPTAWRIFMMKGNEWEVVAQMAQRPSATDVEVSFYNASAANSPLTQGAKFFKGLINRNKKK